MYLYLYPLLGFTFLGLGGWAGYQLGWAVRGSWPAAPGWFWRGGASFLGICWGWGLTNMEYHADPTLVVVGFPLPVATLQSTMGHWRQQGSPSAPFCVLVNVAVGLALGNLILYLGWLAWRERLERRHRPPLRR